MLSCNSLCNAYTPIYDLVLLLPSVVLTVEYLSSTRRDSLANHPMLAQFALGTIFFGPHLSQALAPALGIQLFVFALIAGLAGQLTLATRHRAVCGTRATTGSSAVASPAGSS